MKPHITPSPAWGAGWFRCHSLGITGYGGSARLAYAAWISALQAHHERRRFYVL